MADSDIPARIELMRLKTLVNILAMTVSSQGSQIKILTQFATNVKVANNLTDLSIMDCSRAEVLLLKADVNGDFGIYFPATTPQSATGTDYVYDSSGTCFQLFR